MKMALGGRMNIASDYSVEQYEQDIDSYGMTKTWEAILASFNDKNYTNGIISIANLGELYEIGLAYVNKTDKKEQGKYYTPDDVAKIMSTWLVDLNGENVCDVCCGTGNLILSYLNLIGEEKAKKLISSGKIYLYDQDSLALTICKETLGIIYGQDIKQNINCIVGDFLNEDIALPNNCKVICNPPYFKIRNIKSEWKITDVIRDSKEFYSAFMEKIIKSSCSSVFITPYSFIGGDKFYSLRKVLNNYNGFIVSFDNVPGNIFIGRKHGIFNSNSTNAVRAAITVVENIEKEKGFRCSGLIRFKNEEREKLLKPDVLKAFIGEKHQIVSDENKKYVKCFPVLDNVYEKWEQNSTIKISDITSSNGKYTLCVPNTCRYYTVAAKKNLEREGKNYLSFDKEDIEKIAYCFINSSFCYWHWRLYDGGITYNVSLLNSAAIPLNSLSSDDKTRLIMIADEMQASEKNYLSYKKNAGEMQENIKFPAKYREEIDDIFLKAIGAEYKSDVFDIVHSNKVFFYD